MEFPHVFQERIVDVETMHTEVQIRCAKCHVPVWVDDLTLDWRHDCTTGLWRGIPKGEGEAP